MKKILVVGDFISGSGLTQVIFNVFSLFPSSYKVEVAAYGQDPTNFTDEQCESNNWKLYRVIPVTKNPRQHWKWWKKFFKSNHYDIVYFNYSSSWNFLPLIYAKKYSQAQVIVSHSHNSYFSHTFSNKIMMCGLTLLNNYGKHIFNKYSDIKIATSNEAGQWMFGNKGKNIHVITNGMNLKKFAYSDEQRKLIRKQLNIKDNERLVGFVGVLQDRKDPLLALNVFDKYHQINPNSKMIMLGKGPLKEKILEEIHSKRLESSVISYDFVADIYHWYSAMDALLFTSKYEGFGLVALEAQISKLPVLASNTNIEEIFATKNIYKMDNLDVSTWATKLEKVINDLNNRNNQIEPELQKFSVEKQAETIQNLLMNN